MLQRLIEKVNNKKGAANSVSNYKKLTVKFYCKPLLLRFKPQDF